MGSKIALRLAVPAVAMAFAIPASAGQGNPSAEWSVAAQLAAKFNCSGREYFDEAGNYYDFVPGREWAPGYWVGPIDRTAVAQFQTHSHCHYPAIGSYLGYGGTGHPVHKARARHVIGRHGEPADLITSSSD